MLVSTERSAAVTRILERMTSYPHEVVTPFALRINPAEVKERMGMDFIRLPQYSTRTNRWRFTNEFDAARFKKEYVK